MKQENTLNFTKKILDHTQFIVDKSKNVYKPSPRVSRIGARIGICVGIGIWIGAIVQMVMGKPVVYAVISLLLAGSTIFSNTLYLKKMNH